MLKLPQMIQLGNCGLILSHSFESGITSAFLHGWNVLSDSNFEVKVAVEPFITNIRKLLHSHLVLWNHPLLLPVIILKEHLTRAHLFKSIVLLEETTRLQAALGVTKSGRLRRYQSGRGFKDIRLIESEESRINLTTAINTTLADDVSLATVLKWDARLCVFLLKACDEVREFQTTYRSRHSERKIREWLNTLECGIASCLEHADSLKSQLELQLSVVRPATRPIHHLPKESFYSRGIWPNDQTVVQFRRAVW